MKMTAIALIAAVAAVTAAGCSGAHPPRHAASASPSPSDLSCQTAQNAEIRAEGALGAGFSTTSLSRAATIWKLAVQKITDSGVNLQGTRDGQLVADIDLAVVWADDAVLALDLGKPSSASKANDKLLAAEQKITSDCGG